MPKPPFPGTTVEAFPKPLSPDPLAARVTQLYNTDSSC